MNVLNVHLQIVMNIRLLYANIDWGRGCRRVGANQHRNISQSLVVVDATVPCCRCHDCRISEWTRRLIHFTAFYAVVWVGTLCRIQIYAYINIERIHKVLCFSYWSHPRASAIHCTAPSTQRPPSTLISLPPSRVLTAVPKLCACRYYSHS